MSEWIKTTLGELSAPGRSVISGPFGSDIGAQFFQSEGIPVIRGNNLTTDHRKFVDEGFVFVSEEKADDLDADASEDDLLFTAAGTIGQVGMIPKNCRFGRYVISNKQIRFRIDRNKIDLGYLYAWLTSPWTFKAITNRNTGSTVPLINLGVVRSIPVSLPKDAKIQRAIGHIFSNLDAKIDLNNRINAELEALAKTIYDYWFVQFDFPDANGRPYKSSGGKMVWNEALKREIPAGWEVVPLRSLVECNASSYGTNNLPDKIAYLDTGNLTENRLFNLEQYDTRMVEVPSRARRIVANGDVLYSTVRPNQNHHGIIKQAIDNLVASTGFAVLTCTDKHLNGDFIYMFIRTGDVATKMQRIAESSRSSYPSIAPDDLLDLKLALPESRAQIDYAAQIFDQTFKTIWANEKQNRELTHLRDWLLPLLMNGQVRVPQD